MTDETSPRENRVAEWARRAPDAAGANAAMQAATLIVVRDGSHGLETLMLRRSAQLAFVAGTWVFPGGRVESGDAVGLAADDEIGAARRAAVREAREEAGLEILNSERNTAGATNVWRNSAMLHVEDRLTLI